MRGARPRRWCGVRRTWRVLGSRHEPPDCVALAPVECQNRRWHSLTLSASTTPKTTSGRDEKPHG
ncbi:hypothetical protein CURTO8I2_170094 [Curtobacterium sp. 8I-2]|nr:hypothetical protein CURTO8I2_170094 [Curtobacterium sp. 8I-2]